MSYAYTIQELQKKANQIQALLNGEAGGIVQSISRGMTPLVKVYGLEKPLLAVGDRQLVKSLNKGDLVLGWVDVHSSNFVVEKAGSRKMFESFLHELRNAITILTTPLFYIARQERGISQPPRFFYDLAEIVLQLHASLDDEFDPKTDDAQVFDENDNCVYVFTPLRELKRRGEAEYISEDGRYVVTLPDHGPILPGGLRRLYPNYKENLVGKSK